jgi:hypothetical protein
MGPACPLAAAGRDAQGFIPSFNDDKIHALAFEFLAHGTPHAPKPAEDYMLLQPVNSTLQALSQSKSIGHGSLHKAPHLELATPCCR